MNWPAYTQYRESASGEIPPVPTHWNVAPIKRVGTIRYGIGEPPPYVEVGTPLIRATNVSSGRISEQGLVYVDPNDIPAQRILWLAVDDIVVVRSGAYTGDSARITDKYAGSIAGFDMVLRVEAADPAFVQYSLLSGYLKHGQIDVARTRAAQPHLNAEELGSCLCILPTMNEQQTIVRFLDRETAKIDALIAKQERLIATLREDRTATITHAVTKGIDADVEMEESGVEWLGEIPRHWTHSFVKYAATLLSGYPFKSEGFTHDSDDVRLLRGANVGVNEIDWTDVVRWPSDEAKALADYELQQGDIVMGLDRPFISTGIRVSRIGPEDLPSLLLQRVARLRAVANFEQDYLFHLLTGPGILHHLTPMFTGVSVPHVSPDQVGSLPIPQPPLAEQRRIVSYLADRCSQIDSLIKKASASIDVLREYRSALITDAVTGKIDVRGVA